jgi:hypothetical protein
MATRPGAKRASAITAESESERRDEHNAPNAHRPRMNSNERRRKYSGCSASGAPKRRERSKEMQRAIELKFETFKETPHKIRYEEVSQRGEPVVGSLYVSKEALTKLQGNLHYLRVTIEDATFVPNDA